MYIGQRGVINAGWCSGMSACWCFSLMCVCVGDGTGRGRIINSETMLMVVTTTIVHFHSKIFILPGKLTALFTSQ